MITVILVHRNALQYFKGGVSRSIGSRNHYMLWVHRGQNIEDHKKGLIISLSLKTLILSLSSIVYLTEKTRLSKLPQVRVAIFVQVEDVLLSVNQGFTDSITIATLKGQFIQSTSYFTFIFCFIYFLDFLLIQGS